MKMKFACFSRSVARQSLIGIPFGSRSAAILSANSQHAPLPKTQYLDHKRLRSTGKSDEVSRSRAQSDVTIDPERQVTLPPPNPKTSDPRVDVQQLLTDMKRGGGYRASFSGLVVTVFGPSHLLGRSLVNRLGKIGSQIIVAYRGEPYKLREMKVAADLGQVLFFPTNVLDETSVKRALEYSNVCINLVGSRLMRATMNFSNTDVHVNAARLIARCARQVGVQRLVHVSALNASHNPPQFVKKGGSDFYRMKAAGEEAVRSEFPNAIVFRPSDMFGFDDSFLHYYAARKRRSAGGALCLWELGRETIKAPVFYSDVAQGIVNALLYQGTDGQTYECVGPYRYILADLVDYMYQCMQWFDPHIKLTNFTLPFLAKAMLYERLKTTPKMTMDRIEQEFITDRLTPGTQTLEALGIRPVRIEERFEWELRPYRKYHYYSAYIGEFPDPVPPRAVGDTASHRAEVERDGDVQRRGPLTHLDGVVPVL